MLSALAGMVMLLAAQEGTRASNRLWVDAAAQLRCPDRDSVLAALRARLGNDRVSSGRAPARGLVFRLIPRGSRGVTMSLRRGLTVIVEREIEVDEGECAALAHTLALMTESWLAAPAPLSAATESRAQPASSPADARMPGQPAGEAPAPGATAESSPAAESLPGLVTAPSASVPQGAAPTASPPGDLASPAMVAAPSPRAAPPLPEPAPSPAIAAPSQVAVSPGASRPQARRWSASIAADAGGMVSLDRRATLGATAHADFGIEIRDWLLGIRGALESAADLDDSSGKLLVRHVPVTAYLGRILVTRNRLSFAMLAGGGFDVVVARASGYSSGRSLDAVDPIVWTGARGE